MSDLELVRERVTAHLRSQVVGPADGEREVVSEPPDRRYLMGILYPRASEAMSYFEESGEALEPPVQGSGKREDDQSGDPSDVAATNTYLPSSVGISFLTNAQSVRVHAAAARYDVQGGGKSGPRSWQRVPCPQSATDVSKTATVRLWDGRAEIDVRWRTLGLGSLVTVTIANTHATRETEDPSRLWQHMLFQVTLEVEVNDGALLEYPTPSNVSTEPDELELRLLYRDRPVYAVGHGCAADWDIADGAHKVRAEVLPTVSVPAIAAGGDSRAEILELANLADGGLSDAEVIQGLRAFVGEYRSWVAKRRSESSTIGAAHTQAASGVVERLARAADRMDEGISVLESEPSALRAFRLANRAMRLQMRHSEEDLAGQRRARTVPVVWPDAEDGEYRWRPFQLGFVLTALTGLVDPNHPDRDVVDLIWFPTGGGKTEAYLLLSVFEIFRRRLQDGVVGAGTTVLSRYTLSLLTAQQFQRSAGTTCAAEVVRRTVPAELGSAPISIGLWVGKATTPNRYDKAFERVEELRDDDEPKDAFLLERCPWCGTEILPRTRTDRPEDYGIEATESSFRFRCTRTDCEFHERLWVHVVDDDLYDNPPSFLLGTVDKFARLAWEPRAGVLFGNRGRNLPPSLVLQDELHLLTGPLGTIAGVYEAAIELLCEYDGRPAKVVASTATIRRADEQVRGLFARPVALFPPSGLSADSSYFAEVDPTRPSRLFAGVMAQGHTADTATVQSSAALVQAPIALGLDGDELDAYWTLIAYHNSLRELGRTMTIAVDDVPARLSALFGDDDARVFDVEQLTSDTPREDQPGLLDRLGKPCTDSAHVDFLATTNMLSVGVDVPRLALMLMNGQPKTTAEYIQATSRVGRSHVPGLIVSLFRSTRPRDRSHYESFRAYHSALYRHVEPTSVTPFAPPARDRALHAALVLLARHRLGMAADDAATEVLTRRGELEKLVDRLIETVERVEPREAESARNDLTTFLDTWEAAALEAAQAGKRLYYEPHGKGHVNLLKSFEKRGRGRATLQSMRNVDQQTRIVVRTKGSGS